MITVEDKFEAGKIQAAIEYLEFKGELDNIKAQAIEEVVSLFFDDSCYDPVLDVRDSIVDYANKLRGEK
jgi:hypothetical protein